MEYAEKMRQANREAKAAAGGLVATIVVWAVLGFGVAKTGIVVFATPLWIITGCAGTFVFAVGVACVLSKFVFKDVGIADTEPLDEMGEETNLSSRTIVTGETGVSSDVR